MRPTVTFARAGAFRSRIHPAILVADPRGNIARPLITLVFWITSFEEWTNRTWSVHDRPRRTVAFLSGETRTLPAPSAELGPLESESCESGGPWSSRRLAIHLEKAHNGQVALED
jgi:hypothetical protein